MTRDRQITEIGHFVVNINNTLTHSATVQQRFSWYGDLFHSSRYSHFKGL